VDRRPSTGTGRYLRHRHRRLRHYEQSLPRGPAYRQGKGNELERARGDRAVAPAVQWQCAVTALCSGRSPEQGRADVVV